MEDWNVPGRKRGRSPIPVDCEFALARLWNKDPDPATWDSMHGHLGHFAIELWWVSGDVLDENGRPRNGLYLHGFSAQDLERISKLSPASTAAEVAAAHTSSLGCIEMPLEVREAAWRLAQAGEELRTVR